jgi:hypothetical protein
VKAKAKDLEFEPTQAFDNLRQLARKVLTVPKPSSAKKSKPLRKK